MALSIVIINGKEYVRIATKYITVKGVKIYPKDGKQCFFINIPLEKFDPTKYKG